MADFAQRFWTRFEASVKILRTNLPIMMTLTRQPEIKLCLQIVNSRLSPVSPSNVAAEGDLGGV